ncbi:hypothetical protein CK203_075793 [Vitis vinifera]|uniref:Uncharacterized protein n=1 Tax=Vitis vinifera TaxID=29760 RepID=A0A438F6Z8_VITVI|nr:hypothetical protein CK203_075793 [Vitis vinifera]
MFSRKVSSTFATLAGKTLGREKTFTFTGARKPFAAANAGSGRLCWRRGWKYWKVVMFMGLVPDSYTHLCDHDANSLKCEATTGRLATLDTSLGANVQMMTIKSRTGEEWEEQLEAGAVVKRHELSVYAFLCIANSRSKFS